MSRNFELLQNLGKEQDIFEADREPVMAMPSPAPVAPLAPVELTPLQLKMDEASAMSWRKLCSAYFWCRARMRLTW